VARLDSFVSTLTYIAQWIGSIGAQTRNDALFDDIPYSLRSLAAQVALLRDELREEEEA
jgi:hypothetical protein